MEVFYEAGHLAFLLWQQFHNPHHEDRQFGLSWPAPLQDVGCRLASEGHEIALLGVVRKLPFAHQGGWMFEFMNDPAYAGDNEDVF